MSKDKITETISAIHSKLDAIEDAMAFAVRADQRFKIGQRVQLTKRADRKGIKCKHGARKGKIVGIDGWTVNVLIDGYKEPHGYHHSFFDPVGAARKSKRKRN